MSTVVSVFIFSFYSRPTLTVNKVKPVVVSSFILPVVVVIVSMCPSSNPLAIQLSLLFLSCLDPLPSAFPSSPRCFCFTCPPFPRSHTAVGFSCASLLSPPAVTMAMCIYRLNILGLIRQRFRKVPRTRLVPDRLQEGNVAGITVRNLHGILVGTRLSTAAHRAGHAWHANEDCQRHVW